MFGRLWQSYLGWIRAVRAMPLVGRRHGAEARLAFIAALEAGEGTEQTTSTLDWTAIRSACLKQMREVGSYCSHTIIRDLVAGQNVLKWRVDVVAPKRFHVTQEALDSALGTLRDEWVSIGDKNFQNAGFWFQTEDRNAGINESLSIDGLLQIVDSRNPDSCTLIRYEHAGYLVARYASADLAAADSLLAAYAIDAAADLEVWIEAGTKRIIKGQVSKREESQEIGRVVQAFTCFDEPIDVQPPPWLNAVPIPSGGYKGVDDRIPILRHHQ